jgi:putative hydrolase of the HAD superfamily
MPAYQHIFFDLDHTLWDFDRSSCETLEELYHIHNLRLFNDIRAEDFISTFHRINRDLWSLYSAGQITQSELRSFRFSRVLASLEIEAEHLAGLLSEQYIKLCPQKPHLQPFAKEVLDYLQHKYTLHIITNGFSDIQGIKLKSSGITSYFTHIVTCDDAGCKKPDIGIFTYALQRSNTAPAQSLMIGDDLDADVEGARNAGIDHVFYNYDNRRHEAVPTYEITCLSELMKLL